MTSSVSHDFITLQVGGSSIRPLLQGQWPLPLLWAHIYPWSAPAGWSYLHVTCGQLPCDRAPSDAPLSLPCHVLAANHSNDFCHPWVAIPHMATGRQYDDQGWCCRRPGLVLPPAKQSIDMTCWPQYRSQSLLWSITTVVPCCCTKGVWILFWQLWQESWYQPVLSASLLLCLVAAVELPQMLVWYFHLSVPRCWQRQCWVCWHCWWLRPGCPCWWLRSVQGPPVALWVCWLYWMPGLKSGWGSVGSLVDSHTSPHPWQSCHWYSWLHSELSFCKGKDYWCWTDHITLLMTSICL